MHLRTLRHVAAALVFTIFLTFGGVSRAQHRGYFFGSYQISNVTDRGDEVQLTLKVVLLNYTGRDLKECELAVFNSAPVRSSLGAFSTIGTLPAGGQVSLTQKFTVPASVYAQWKQGQKPAMEMTVPMSDGRSRTVPIDLTAANSPAAPVED